MGRLNRLAAGLRGRNRGVFLCELLFALWLAAAKIQAAQQQPKASGKKASPVAGLLKKLARTHPTLPQRRALDGWVEALMAALLARQIITRQHGATGQSPGRSSSGIYSRSRCQTSAKSLRNMKT